MNKSAALTAVFLAAAFLVCVPESEAQYCNLPPKELTQGERREYRGAYENKAYGYSVVPLRKIPLNQIAKRTGFARISQMLSTNTPSSLEDRIIGSLQWAGRAQVEARREEAFLLYAIALESSVLGKNTNTEISNQLAIRCAHLGGGPTLDEKKRVVQQIRSLYDTRSKIVHSGSFVIGKDELDLMRDFSIRTLLTLVELEPFRSMKEVEQLDEWFRSQVLAGGTCLTLP